MSRLSLRVFLLSALLAGSSGPAALAQVVTGSILGSVTDSTGAVVPGAAVQIQNLDTGFSRTEQTDSGGRYIARSLPLGNYSVTVQQPGFSTEVKSGIVLSVGSEVLVNLQLAVGNVQEKVEVTAEAPQVETTNATLSNLVTPEQVRNLPLNGRSLDSLVLLSSSAFTNMNVKTSASAGEGLRITVSGGRTESNLFLIDGVVVNDRGNTGFAAATTEALGVEGVLEFRLLAHNYSAEYGLKSGAVVSMVTRAGTNVLHGSAYEFVRNNIFDDRNFFNPGALPSFRRNQFGAAAGGAVRKDRVFFFANYEGLRQRQGVTVIASVPDVNSRQGILPTGRVTVNPVIVPYLNLYPVPNSTSHGDGTANYIQNFPTRATEDYTLMRMDFRLSDKDNFYWRYVFDPASVVSAAALPTFNTQNLTTHHYLVLSETHVFSGASLNEFRTAFNRQVPANSGASLQPIDSSLSFIPGQPFGEIRYTASGGAQTTQQLSTLGSNAGFAYLVENDFRQNDTFTTVHGRHALKFGIDLSRNQSNELNPSCNAGCYTFGGIQSLLAGQPSSLAVMVQSNGQGDIRAWRRIFFGTFAQDDFRMTPNLTLNLGLRYEFYTAPVEVQGKMEDLRNPTDPATTPGPPLVPSKTNFAPRLGLAWDPKGDGKTAVRLGAGVFFSQFDGGDLNTFAGQSSSYYKAATISNPPFPYLPGAMLPPGELLANPSFPYHFATPTAIQYNVEVQRQLARTLSLQVGYVGSYSYNMARMEEANLKIGQILQDGSVFFSATAPVTNPNFGEDRRVTPNGLAIYNALQVVLRKTISAGLTFQGSYTFSKALSDSDEVNSGHVVSIPPDVQDPYHPGRDWSLSAYDQRRTFVLSSSYQMPWEKWLKGKLEKAALGGWSVNGIYSYGSGLPFTIETGFNNARDNDLTTPDRPNLASGFSNNPTNGVTAGCPGVAAGQKLGTPTLWFNPCAFTLPAAGTFGNLGRDTATAPGYSNLDFALVKMTPITEIKRLEFRAEFFNLLNHPFFGLPTLAEFTSSRTLSGTVGEILATNGVNRQIQLGMKFIF